MELHFAKMNPSGNTTVLVKDPVQPGRYPAISAQLMQDTVLCAEQVGFIVPPLHANSAARLEMMAGEFCGNAARSIAAYEAIKRGISGPAELQIEISGSRQPLLAQVQGDSANYSCEVAIGMPLPKRILPCKLADAGDAVIVEFEGISHLVLFDTVPNKALLAPAKQALIENGCGFDAFGLMFYRPDLQQLTPLVYVGGVDNLVWESSCASGTASVACALAMVGSKDVDGLTVQQPGGALSVSAKGRGGVPAEIRLAGNIVLTAEGTVHI